MDSGNIGSKLAVALILGIDKSGLPIKCEEVDAYSLLFELVEDAGEIINTHKGRPTNSGKNFLAEFDRGLNAINCVIALNEAIRHKNFELPALQQMNLLVDFVH